MASSLAEATREASFQAFEAEFVRNGFRAPEGLLRILKDFKLRDGEGPEAGRARIYRRLFGLLWFGSKLTLGKTSDGKQPTYVYPESLKCVVRNIVSGNLVEKPDPTHARVYKVNIADLAKAKWPAVKPRQ
ncbi:uncharacterized protein LOC110251960 [Exaiptasia diaphana]|uniref:Uncharacterized protein n=1 Tax=Exaiptasia diaphana TaxID=2652724 RepID=A0A913Y5B2_EXADI|nr:uncharacterized protein LOC110251960 [Exaiptasia diaphana]